VRGIIDVLNDGASWSVCARRAIVPTEIAAS